MYRQQLPRKEDSQRRCQGAARAPPTQGVGEGLWGSIQGFVVGSIVILEGVELLPKLFAEPLGLEATTGVRGHSASGL